MSSYSRRSLLLSLTALSACGFEPVYAPGGRAEGLRGRIDLAAPADEEGYALVERLEQRLGQPAGADLGMTADIYVSEEAVGFLPDGTISRYNVSGRVDWRLTRRDHPINRPPRLMQAEGSVSESVFGDCVGRCLGRQRTVPSWSMGSGSLWRRFPVWHVAGQCDGESGAGLSGQFSNWPAQS